MKAPRSAKQHLLFQERILPSCLILALSCLLLEPCHGFFVPATTQNCPSHWRKPSSPTPKHQHCYQSFPATSRFYQSTTSNQERIVNGESGHSTEKIETSKSSDDSHSVEDHQQELLQGEKLLLGGDKRPGCFDERLEELSNKTLTTIIRKKDLMPNAPPLSFNKYLTMQQKRVVVTFRFTDLPYLRPYYLTFASKLKRRHSDLLIEKRVLPLVDGSSSPIFEVLVDGKIVIGDSQSRERFVLGGRVDVQNTQSVFVSMEQLGHAITKARKKRRPSSLYGAEDGNDNPEVNYRGRRTFVG